MSEEIKRDAQNADDDEQDTLTSQDILDILHSLTAGKVEPADADHDGDGTKDEGEIDADLLRRLLCDDDDDDDDDDDEEDEDEDDDGDAEDDDWRMDADDCHNAAVDLSRKGNIRGALNMCLQGLRHFPADIDLLADIIKYGSKLGESAVAERHYRKLEIIPRKTWNWRAFTFAFDYLVERAAVNERACRELIADYKRYLPYEERAYVAESELEAAIGHEERAMSVLSDAIRTLGNASQCALRLADMQMDRGMYEAVIETVGYGLTACAEVQPSINIPYLYLLRALCKDALLHRRAHRNEPVTAEEIDRVIQEYEMMQDEFAENRMRHGPTIKRHISMLRLLKLNI